MRVTLEELTQWLKETDKTRKDVASLCNIQRSAVDGWYLRGKIPKTASALIRFEINKTTAPAVTPASQQSRINCILSLELTNEEFRNYSLAALAQDRILTDWIKSTLNRAARQ